MPFQLLIDGTLHAGASTIDVINPATGQLLAAAPRADTVQAEHAVAAAKRAFPKCSALSYAERRAHLDKVADGVETRLRDFSRLLPQEQGKPIEQATSEMMGTIAALRYFAAQALSPKLLRDTANERIIEQGYPLGVEAIARANDSEYGLGGTIWTSDVERGIEVASRIQSGTVWVNRHLDLPIDVPFGGAKQSSIGRQQGVEGMEEFTRPGSSVLPSSDFAWEIRTSKRAWA